MFETLNRLDLKSRRRGLRKISTDPERVLWAKMRNRQINGYKFRRQYSVERFVLDFYCPQMKLAIEVDGDTHYREKSRLYDDMRSAKIEVYGIQVLRFTNTEVSENVDGVLEKINQTLVRLTSS